MNLNKFNIKTFTKITDIYIHILNSLTRVNRFLAQDKVWHPQYGRNDRIGGDHEGPPYVCRQRGRLEGGTGS